MARALKLLALIGVVAGTAVNLRYAPQPRCAPSVTSDVASASRLFARTATAFIPNVGQWPGDFRYQARFGAMTAFLEEHGWTLSLIDLPSAPALAPQKLLQHRLPKEERVRGASVRMRFVGASTPELTAGDKLGGVHNYFLGNDPAKWRTDVPLHASVLYRGLYPGVDVRVREHDARFEYDVCLEPGSDLSQVEVVVEGAEGVSVDADGSLIIATAVGPVRQPLPVTWEVGSSGERRPLAARYVVRAENRFGFEVQGWQGEGALVLDPGLLYSTILGGRNLDDGFPLSVDSAGVVTLAGATWSSDFPTTAGAWDTTFNGGSDDVFVVRLDPSQPTAQQLRYSTFLGGNNRDGSLAVSVDGAGVVTLAGITSSSDFPTTPGAWDTTLGGGTRYITDGFIARLDPRLPAAQQLRYSTFLGGSSNDQVFSMSVDGTGIVTLAGETWSSDFPTTANAWDTTFNGGWDAFVVLLDPRLPAAQQVIYSTFLGGVHNERAFVLHEASGIVTLAGDTESSDFPTTPSAFDASHSGLRDAFVARLVPRLPAAQQLRYSTFLGGISDDLLLSMSVDGAGVVTLAGVTYSPDFSTTPNAWDTIFRGGTGFDGFIARLDPRLPAAQQLRYSTFFRGGPTSISVDGAGVITVAGTTRSVFPTTAGAWDTTYNGGADVFLARLDPSRPTAQQLRYSTFLGGGSDDGIGAVSVDGAGVVTLVGFTSSPDFPTTPGAFDTSHNGLRDAFVTRLDMLPTGASRYGTSSPGCMGPLAIDVTSMPRIGNATFALTCGNAPPSASGVVPLSAAGLSTPLRLLGLEVWVDPRVLWVTVGATSNAQGAADLPLPIALDGKLVGLKLNAQFVWLGPTTPPPCPPLGFSASAALEITIQS